MHFGGGTPAIPADHPASSAADARWLGISCRVQGVVKQT
jgi:hypothetical protein